MQPSYGLIRAVFSSIQEFARFGSGLELRSYQLEVAQAVLDSVINRRGLTFVVMFPRQSGKNEVQAQIEAYCLMLFSSLDGEIVKVSPTWKPQSLNAMRRLERALKRNALTQWYWEKEQGYIYRVDTARIFFLSGSPTTNVVGATASTLLECDEAQDVLTSKWDKDLAPMAASTNATRVFWGTAWTANTLLARELRAAHQAEQGDGVKRVFRVTADDVRVEVPAYGDFVDGQIARLGRDHPLVRTQFFSEEISAESGMFPPARLALMQGNHTRLSSPQPGQIYAFLLDVAGEDEGAEGLQLALPGLEAGGLAHPRRDRTALTVVEVDLDAQPAGLPAPVYRVRERRVWVGARHADLLGQLVALAELWQPRWVVVDATGVGAGLASLLDRSLPGLVVPFVFTTGSKSRLGWDFLAVVETGRFRDWQPAGSPAGGEQELFWEECRACQMEVHPGPQRRMSWGVPDGTRQAGGGALVHDDLLVSAALCAVLDGKPWGRAESQVVPALDPLAGTGDVY